MTNAERLQIQRRKKTARELLGGSYGTLTIEGVKRRFRIVQKSGMIISQKRGLPDIRLNPLDVQHA